MLNPRIDRLFGTRRVPLIMRECKSPHGVSLHSLQPDHGAPCREHEATVLVTVVTSVSAIFRARSIEHRRRCRLVRLRCGGCLNLQEVFAVDFIYVVNELGIGTRHCL
jgi:hypothetical protein